MTITIDEKFDSRQRSEGDQRGATLTYVVQGTSDDSQVKSLVAATAPVFYDSLRREGYRIAPLGGDVWEVEVTYGEFASTSQFTFDTGGGTQHITQSLITVASYAAPGETAPNFLGAIGVNEERIDGTDITVPVYNFTETHYFDDSLITPAYKAAVFALTGRVNGSGFKGFGVGEVLFLGASGSKRGSEDWEITYRFAASPNVSGLALGPIAGIIKEGWHYLWVRFAEDEDSLAKTLIKRPISVHIEQVYQYGDFSLLGIGT